MQIFMADPMAACTRAALVAAAVRTVQTSGRHTEFAPKGCSSRMQRATDRRQLRIGADSPPRLCEPGRAALFTPRRARRVGNGQETQRSAERGPGARAYLRRCAAQAR